MQTSFFIASARPTSNGPSAFFDLQLEHLSLMERKTEDSKAAPSSRFVSCFIHSHSRYSFVRSEEFSSEAAEKLSLEPAEVRALILEYLFHNCYAGQYPYCSFLLS